MTRFRWWLAGLLTLALPASSALGQGGPLATVALTSPLGHETPESPAEADPAPPRAQYPTCPALCVQQLLADFLDKWALLWHAGEFERAQQLAVRAVQLCPSSIEARHAVTVAQIVNATGGSTSRVCLPGHTGIVEVLLQAGCLPYGEFECEEIRQGTVRALRCEDCPGAAGNAKVCVAATTSACCAKACACGKDCCCALKAKCACGPTCACAKPACACGAKCACAKSACPCCANCGCGTAPQVRIVHVAVPMLPPWFGQAQLSPWVGQAHALPVPPPPVMMPSPHMPLRALLPPMDVDCVYPYPVTCPVMAPPVPAAPPVQVIHSMPVHRMMPTPPVAPVIHHERIEMPVAAAARSHAEPVRIVAGAGGINIQGKFFQARCDCLSLQESQVVLEGNVQIEIRRGNHPSRIEAQRVLVNLKAATFEVSGAAAMRVVQPVSAEPVSRPVYAPMPAPVPQRPMPSMRTKPAQSSSTADPNARMDELLNASELRQVQGEWNLFWRIDQPSHLTPIRVHGGLGP